METAGDARFNSPREETLFNEPRGQGNAIVPRPREDNENAKVREAEEHLAVSNAFPTTGNVSAVFALDSELFERGFVDQIHVLRVIKVRSNEEPGEIESALVRVKCSRI